MIRQLHHISIGGVYFICACLLSIPVCKAQSEIGLRFSSYFNSFRNARSSQLVENSFSTGLIGVYAVEYKRNSRIELGLNLIHKSGANQGFPNLPLIMQDFGDNQNVGLTAIEFHFKAGPSFGLFNPKVGYAVGYLLSHNGFQIQGGQDDVNRLYFSLPVGFSFDFPTQFGSVGVGSSYHLGLTNVLKNPGAGVGNGTMRSFSIELTIAYGYASKSPRTRRK